MQKVTIFKNIKDTKNPNYVFPDQLYLYIKNGRWKELIEKVRQHTDKKDRDKIKQELPSICFSGIFEQRSNDKIKSHSGLVCIDFDHVENLLEFKQRIIKDKYTYMAFISPSGDGLKVIVKIPDCIETHADSCRALNEYYNNEKLDDFKDVARVCYASYDREAYINPKSEIFNKLIEDKKVIQNVFYPNEIINDTNDIFERLIKWLDNKFEVYTDGNKHTYLVKLSSACMRFGIPQSECVQRLYFTYGNAASKVSINDIQKIVERVYKNYSGKACTAHFETNGTPIYTQTKKEIKDEIFEINIHNKDIIYLDNVRDSMFEGFKTGKSKGTSTYFNSFNKNWTWRKKELTFIGGIGNIGKTTMINNLCLLKAINEDWRFAIFSPEQDPPDDFYNDLIHAYIGKSTEPYHDNQMTIDEYKEGMEFIGNHFYYIFPDNESPTPDYINACFEEAIKKHKVDVCIVDPFNQLDNDWKKYNRDDLYISEFLTKNKRFSQKHDIAYMIAGHPKTGLTMTAGNYNMPNVYDYAGGAMWNNKCDNILCYHRPFAITEPENTLCMFVSQKIKKRKLTGNPGQCPMYFDIKTSRFIEENGNNPYIKDKLINDFSYDPSNGIEPQLNWYESNKEELEPPF